MDGLSQNNNFAGFATMCIQKKLFDVRLWIFFPLTYRTTSYEVSLSESLVDVGVLGHMVKGIIFRKCQYIRKKKEVCI